MRAAKAVNYEGAGTIEFIADASKGLKADRIWFMEMNTRLQVEHPVTEEITGQDLVEWQLRVASGEKLPKKQDELSIDGWAIEARLYAEDPAKGFLPSVGPLDHFDLGDDGRIETGVEEGDAISPYYDPMIAKLVARGDDRAEAIGELAAILDEVEVWPVHTNAGFLFNALLQPEFGAAEIDTGFIERHLDELVPDAEPDDAIWRGAAAVALAIGEDEESFGDLAGFRLNAPVAHGRCARPPWRVSDGLDRRRRVRGGFRFSGRRAGRRLLRGQCLRVRADCSRQRGRAGRGRRRNHRSDARQGHGGRGFAGRNGCKRATFADP